MPMARLQVTLQFDTTLKRVQFDGAILALVHQIEADGTQLTSGHIGKCVYIATELVNRNLIRNEIDGFDVGVG